MKMIASVTVIVIVAACAMAMAPQMSRMKAGGSQADLGATYEHLATAIIAVRETEDSLVHDMLAGYLAAAQAQLDQAASASGSDRQRRLEAAAEQITNLANEGDKRVQAIRQRLLKAGHHHHSDADTQDDYMFIDSREKAALLLVAGKVAQLRQATAADIRATAEQLSTLAEGAMKPE